MVRPHKPIQDPVLKEWLAEFKSKKTSILIPLVLIVAHYSSGADLTKGADEISDFTKT